MLDHATPCDDGDGFGADRVRVMERVLDRTGAGAQDAAPDRAMALWLYGVAALVFAMTVIGAITRLTESGLSMVEWRPLIGALPPLSEAEWQRVFDLYRETPEYRLKNAGMSLEDFRRIFFWEWFHRLWGRLIGLAYAVPLAWFWLRGHLAGRPGLSLRLLGLLVLGGLQGVLGWYMVASGLVDRPSVSHYRLAAHLGLAVLIYALLVWQATDLLDGGRAARAQAVAGGRRLGWLALAAVAVTAVWGAFVAGLDAGIGYNTWPRMGAYWLPPQALSVEAAYVAAPAAVAPWQLPFENTALVQFLHRWLAFLALAGVLAFSVQVARAGLARVAAALAVVGVGQVVLGIATLLSFVAIPLAALHQAGALVLIGLLILTIRRLRASCVRMDADKML